MKILVLKINKAPNNINIAADITVTRFIPFRLENILLESAFTIVNNPIKTERAPNNFRIKPGAAVGQIIKNNPDRINNIPLKTFLNIISNFV